MIVVFLQFTLNLKTDCGVSSVYIEVEDLFIIDKGLFKACLSAEAIVYKK